MQSENPLPGQDAQAPLPEVPAAPPSRLNKLTLRLARWVSHPKAPFVAAGVLLLAVAGAWFQHNGAGMPLIGRPAIVVFDPVKFVNAQRAAASILALSPSADMSLTLTQVAKQSEAVIREEARGAVVLVKQSVVVPDDLPDITDAVLQRFGLPTTVPTVSTKPGALSLESVAPTDSAFSAGKLREDYRLELQQRAGELVQEDGKRDKQARMVP